MVITRRDRLDRTFRPPRLAVTTIDKDGGRRGLADPF